MNTCISSQKLSYFSLSFLQSDRDVSKISKHIVKKVADKLKSLYKNERENLFEKIEDSLNTNGYFVGEFFSTKQLEFNSGGPKDLDLLYTIEDFQNYFNLCKKNITEEIVILDEGIGHQGEACVIRVVIQKI